LLDAETEEPVAYAAVVCPDQRTGTQTDEQGRFDLQVPAGPVRIVVEQLGYQPFSQVFAITDTSALAPLTLRLQPKSIDLDATEIVYWNPADRIVRNAISAKKVNGPQAFQSWKVTAYNKFTLLLANISEEKMEKSLLLRPAPPER
jgi:hypothetical protein